MIDKIRDKQTDEMFKAILSLKTVDECYKFFDDLCTVKELQSISQRFEVAKMLSKHQVYSDIVGASTATISRVRRSLEYGNDGYQMVFERIYQDGIQ